MARYHIEPSGVEGVVNAVGKYAQTELTKTGEDVQDATQGATGHLDPTSPLKGLFDPFGLAVKGQIKSVYAATVDVLTAAVNATNAYVEADVEMARRGEHGVTVTRDSVSGRIGDRAQAAGAREVGGLSSLPKIDADNAQNGSHPSLSDWLSAVNGG